MSMKIVSHSENFPFKINYGSVIFAIKNDGNLHIYTKNINANEELFINRIKF